jgi:AcrR family transcriptional regulator
MATLPPSDTIPTQARARERMANVLCQAEQMMIEDGYASLTMRKLAERCGIALGNLQYYFPSKSDLVAALVEGICVRHRHSLTKQLNQNDDPLAAFKASLRYMLEDIRKPEGSVLYWELWALAAHDSATNAAVTKLYHDELELLVHCITRLNPDLPSPAIRLRAQTVMSMVEGSTLLMNMKRAALPEEGRPMQFVR